MVPADMTTANACSGGGMPQSTNRSYWPVDGGAVSIQPGWFPGHSKALFYVNIGIQEDFQTAPPNMSHPVVPPFQILGPSNNEYPGQFCLPQVPMPVNVTLHVGQKITLQVVETAQHGAALYNVSCSFHHRIVSGPTANRLQCVDLELVDNNDPRIEPVNATNCYNSSDISFELVFTTAALSNTASSAISTPSMVPILFTAIVALAMTML